MIIETLVTAFVVAFVAIVLLGHVLLAQALLWSDRETPAAGTNSRATPTRPAIGAVKG